MNFKAVAWLAVFGGFFVWSAIEPYDRLTWWLEVAAPQRKVLGKVVPDVF